MCNKCNNQSCTCIDNGCNPIDASCVKYNLDGSLSDLNCISEISPGTSLKVILETWDQYFCEFNNVPLLSCVKEKLGFPADTDITTYSQFLGYLQNWICNTADIKVKVSPSDASSGYLFDKIELGECLSSTITTDENGIQKLKLSVDFPCFAIKMASCIEIQSNECITIDNSGLPCYPQPTIPVISRSGVVLSGQNCNGVIQWYNKNNQLVGTGINLTVPPNDTYYAKCVTACGESGASSNIPVPNIIIYTKTRTAYFTRNNCGVNSCNVACSGTSSSFSKTYTSPISQAIVDAIAENDLTFAVDGQNYANTLGTCTCSDCNCVFPTYNSNILVTNASCNGNIISANGQIFIVGIANANKFGYSVGQGDYNGVNYEAAFSLTNFNAGNIETTGTSIKLKALSIETRITFRIFNGANNCYRDVVVTLTPPDCTQEQVEIVDTTVSCEIEESACKNWLIQAGPSGASVWYVNCGTNNITFNSIPQNDARQFCSPTMPTVTGGIATENGICI